MGKKRAPTEAQLQRDAHDNMMRRCLGLVGLYQEMMQSHLTANSFDDELVRRMLSVRQTVMALLEAAMPTPGLPQTANDGRPMIERARELLPPPADEKVVALPRARSA